MDAFAAAAEYADAGLSVFAVPYGQKDAQGAWGYWRERRATRDELRAMFGNGPVNTAIAFGSASGNALGLDCDTPQRYAEGCAVLAGLGIRTWVVRRPECGDPHDGGGLFVFRTRGRAQGRNHSGPEVRSGGYSLIPISRHPGGGDYFTVAGSPRGIFTLPSLDALAPWIELEPWAPLPSLADLQAELGEQGSIPSLAWSILHGNEEVIGRYPSRSEAEQAAITSLVNANHDFESVKALFLSNPGAGKFAEMQRRNWREAFAWLRLSYRQAARFVIENPYPARVLARNLQQWALSRPWPGKTGATDRAVYLAHLSLVEKCGRQPHGASCRELAELAGCSWRTASVANRRFHEVGLLTLETAATATLSNRFSLVDVTECAQVHTHSQNTTVSECELMHTEHDLFRWAGLNKSGAEVYEELQARETATVNELAAATGRHRTTVTRKLNTMFKLGFVEPVGNGVWRFVGGSLEKAAEKLGTAGMGERQRDRHERQRLAQREQFGWGRVCGPDSEATEV